MDEELDLGDWETRIRRREELWDEIRKKWKSMDNKLDMAIERIEQSTCKLEKLGRLFSNDRETDREAEPMRFEGDESEVESRVQEASESENYFTSSKKFEVSGAQPVAFTVENFDEEFEETKNDVVTESALIPTGNILLNSFEISGKLDLNDVNLVKLDIGNDEINTVEGSEEFVKSSSDLALLAVNLIDSLSFESSVGVVNEFEDVVFDGGGKLNLVESMGLDCGNENSEFITLASCGSCPYVFENFGWLKKFGELKLLGVRAVKLGMEFDYVNLSSKMLEEPNFEGMVSFGILGMTLNLLVMVNWFLSTALVEVVISFGAVILTGMKT